MSNSNTYLDPKNISALRPIFIPKELIYNKDMLDRRIIIYCYLFCNKRYNDNTVLLNIDMLLNWSLLKHDRHKGGINEIYEKSLELFILNKYLYIKDSSLKNKYVLFELNREKFIPSSFGLIYTNELNVILNYKNIINDKLITSRTTSAGLLLVLSYIRSNLRISGLNNVKTCPECCYRYYNTISNDLGLTEKMISKYVNILKLLKIIDYKEVPRYQSQDGTWHTDVKVFANYFRYVKTLDGYEIDTSYISCDEIDWQIKLLLKSRSKYSGNTS